jgi:hypothetical protein
MARLLRQHFTKPIHTVAESGPNWPTVLKAADVPGDDCWAFDGCKFTRADQTRKTRPRKLAAPKRGRKT